MIHSDCSPTSSIRRTAQIYRTVGGAFIVVAAISLLTACGGSDDAVASPTVASGPSPTGTASQASSPVAPTVAATLPASPTTAPPAATQPAATQPPAPTQAPAPSARSVAVAGFAFSPGALTVPVGTAVTWTWSGDDFHNVAGAAFSSGGPVQSGKFSFTFTAAGTYAYACDVHSAAGMTGTVTVQ